MYDNDKVVVNSVDINSSLLIIPSTLLVTIYTLLTYTNVHDAHSRAVPISVSHLKTFQSPFSRWCQLLSVIETSVVLSNPILIKPVSATV